LSKYRPQTDVYKPKEVKVPKQLTIAIVIVLIAIGGWIVASTIFPATSDASNDIEESESQNVDPVRKSQADNLATGTNPTPPEFADEKPPRGAESEFATDFSRHTISYNEILSGGPPKDGISPIDQPDFVDVEAADAWLKPLEPVVLFQIGDDTRAYPLQILTWHEIVNDTVNGVPVTVTFCPLCNTAIAFERTFDGQVLDFGTSGRLRFSNLIMYDRQTETWWQQASGDGIAGRYAGSQLTFLPAAIIGWEDFKANHPEGKVLSRDTGFTRDYGRNPYGGYDNINNSPFLFQGPEDGRLPAMARVLTLDLGTEAVAYPFDLLSEVRVINDFVAEEPVVVLWEAGTASALDSSNLAQGRDVGSANTFSPVVDGRTLTFRFDGSQIVDEQTQSVWNVLGQAKAGELAGEQLESVVSVNHFWFSWAAFRPATRIYTLPDNLG
jgi:hypothetical protein